MGTSIHTARILAIVTILSLPAMVSAQQTESAVKPSAAERFEAGLTRITNEFWTPRLNRYKVEIDRMLSATDLVAVNELRVRNARVMERFRELARKQEEQSRMTAQHDADEYSSYLESESMRVDTVISRSDAEEDFEELERYRNRMHEEMRDNWERQVAEQQKQDLLELERAVAGTAEPVERNPESFDYKNEPLGEEHRFAIEQSEAAQESAALHDVAKWIARNYRPGMEELVGTVLSDMKEFFEVTRVHAREFIAAEGNGILKDEDVVAAMMHALRSIREIQNLENQTGMGAGELRSMIESFLMLYNGQDLQAFMMMDNSPVAEKAAGELAASSDLGQNTPNPASTRTTIPYRLAEPGTQVVIQIIDTRGSLVATFDQGSREAGEHAATIDVASLTPGTYLYQLRVTTPSGERISSKGMQVVR